MSETSTQHSSDNIIISGRYRANLALFVVLMLAVLFWFHRHLYQYVTGTTFLGGTLTLWGAWKLLQSWVKWGLDASEISIARRLLSRTAATELLIFGFILIGALYFATSSIYLVYEGADKGEDKFEVSVLNHGNPYLAPITITSFEGTAGQPLFLRTASVDLAFSIETPRGYQVVKRRFRPWTSLRIRVPADFQRKNIRLLRLIPGLTLINKLPKRNDIPTVKYYLLIETQQKSYRIEDLRRQTVFAGVSSKEDFEYAMGGLANNDTKTELDQYLQNRGVPLNDRHDKISNWQSIYQFCPTNEFIPRDEITITVGQQEEPTPLLTNTIKVSDKNVMTTFFMEIQQ